jgi:hypothetical protein
MRYRILVVAIVLALSGSAFAVSSAALPYDLTLSAPLTSVSSQSKVVNGSRFGGVPVTGTVQGTTTAGTLNLLTDGKPFATGTYACGSGGCTFTGTVAGKSVSGMSLTTASSFTGKTTSTATTAMGKATSNAFPNHGAWVSAVSGWAKSNLSSSQRGQIVSSAAKVEGTRASGKTDRGQASGQAGQGKNVNNGNNGANGSDDGKGGKGKL